MRVLELRPAATLIRMDFSIVIPTYERPGALAACLAGVAALETRYAVEVLVVNDGGAPPPPGVGARVSQRFPFTLLEQANAGPAAARNLGAAHARGRWLAFLDDDCVPRPDWLEQLAAALGPRTVVGGQVVNGLAANPYSTASQTLLHFLYAYYHAAGGHPAQIPFLTTNNLALAAETFRAVGGMDARLRLGEDRELCARLVRAGYVLRVAPRAVVAHYHVLNARTFWAQHVRYGRGAFAYRQRTEEGDAPRRPRSRPEPPAFYAAMLSWPWRGRAPMHRAGENPARGPHAVRIAALIAVTQLANAWGFFAAWRESRRAQPQSLKRRDAPV